MNVELKIVFDACMRYRKSILADSEIHEVNVYSHLGDLVKESLCPLDDESRYNRMECIQRACLCCGADEIKLLPEETSDEGEVVWKRYEYVETGKTGPDGKEQKKLPLYRRKCHQRNSLTS